MELHAARDRAAATTTGTQGNARHLCSGTFIAGPISGVEPCERLGFSIGSKDDALQHNAWGPQPMIAAQQFLQGCVWPDGRCAA